MRLSPSIRDVITWTTRALGATRSDGPGVNWAAHRSSRYACSLTPRVSAHPLLFSQLLVGAAPSDSTAVEDEDLIGIADCRQVVGDDNG